MWSLPTELVDRREAIYTHNTYVGMLIYEECVRDNSFSRNLLYHFGHLGTITHQSVGKIFTSGKLLPVLTAFKWKTSIKHSPIISECKRNEMKIYLVSL